MWFVMVSMTSCCFAILSVSTSSKEGLETFVLLSVATMMLDDSDVICFVVFTFCSNVLWFCELVRAQRQYCKDCSSSLKHVWSRQQVLATSVGSSRCAMQENERHNIARDACTLDLGSKWIFFVVCQCCPLGSFRVGVLRT